MGSRIISSLLAMALIFALPVFSFADGEELLLKDSGSPMASTFAMNRSLNATSSRAVSLPPAPDGYEWVSYGLSPIEAPQTGSIQFQLKPLPFVAGKQLCVYDFNLVPYRFAVWNYSTSSLDFSYTSSTSSGYFTFDFTPSESGSYVLYANSTDMSFSCNEFDLYYLSPLDPDVPLPDYPDGSISSGFEFHSGIISNSTRSDFESFDFSFGDQPAGEYLINIYHWGDSYDVNFYIYDSNEKYYPVTTAGGVSTFIYKHSGGTMAFDGNFSIVNTDTSAVDGSLTGSGYANPSWVAGELDAHGPLSWTFNIENIVSFPLELSEDSDFGIYSLIVGFLRNQFSDMKSFLAEQFDKDEEAYTGATSPELSQDINSASSMIEQEQQFMTDINTQITDQSSKVDPVTVIDGIDGSVDILNSMLWVSNIVSTTFDSLGVFQFLIYVPIILGIVNLVIGRGVSFSSFSVPMRRRSKSTGLVPYDSNTGMRKGGS